MTSFWVAAQPFEDSSDDDFLVYLSEQWWTPWVFLGICMVAGFWMIRSLLVHRGREQQIRRAATDSGMDYRAEDGFGLSRVSFRHMANAKGRGWSASQVVTLTAPDGARVHAFDVRSWTEVAGQETSGGEQIGHDRIRRKHQGATQSAAMAPLPINAPGLVIGRENLVSKLFATATRIDLDVESEAFNRSYHVIGEDRTFARDVLDAQMIDLMISTEGKITFEFVGQWLLLHTSQIEPELMPGLARLADEMRQVVPALVIGKWGSGVTTATVF